MTHLIPMLIQKFTAGRQQKECQEGLSIGVEDWVTSEGYVRLEMASGVTR